MNNKGGLHFLSVLNAKIRRIDTSIGNLIMTNQFLQFVTYLPSSNVYGFGEFSHRHLRSSSFFKTFAMFSRDQPPQVNWQQRSDIGLVKHITNVHHPA